MTELQKGVIQFNYYEDKFTIDLKHFIEGATEKKCCFVSLLDLYLNTIFVKYYHRPIDLRLNFQKPNR